MRKAVPSPRCRQTRGEPRRPEERRDLRNVRCPLQSSVALGAPKALRKLILPGYCVSAAGACPCSPLFILLLKLLRSTKFVLSTTIRKLASWLCNISASRPRALLMPVGKRWCAIFFYSSCSIPNLTSMVTHSHQGSRQEGALTSPTYQNLRSPG